MSKNLTRKGLALGTVAAFAISGLTAVALPASAATAGISIAPTTGTGYAAYNTDYLNVDVTIDTDVVTSSSYDKTAIVLTAADSGIVSVKLDDGLAAGTWSAGTDACTYSLPTKLTTSLGATTTVTFTKAIADAGTDLASAADCTGSTYGGSAAVFSVNFTQGGVKYTTAVIDLTGVAGTSDIKVSVNANDGATATDHKNRTVGIQAFLDTDEDEVLEATDKFPSDAASITFYDAANVSVTPRIERFVDNAGNLFLNEAAGDLGGSLQFSPALNLDQIDLTNITIDSSDAAIDTFVPAVLSGHLTHSSAGRIYGEFNDGGGVSAAVAVDTAVNIVVKVANADAAGTGTKDTTSPSFTIPKQATAGITADAGFTVDLTDDSIKTNAAATSATLRAGTKTFTYTAAGTFASGAVAANVPVIAHVDASAIGVNETLTVSGKTLAKGTEVLVSGVTNADGEYSLAVTASGALAGEAYKVNFYFLLNNGTFANNVAEATVTYAASAGNAISQASAILGGDSVTATYTIKDQFGTKVSANADGDTYSVKVVASNVADLSEYVAVVDGVATVTFDNYLAVGLSDSISATVGTGLTSSAFVAESLTTTSSVSATLYNSEAAAGITVAPAATAGNVSYEDFITGTANSTTNVAPSTGGVTFTGTLVDESGVGIPGAAVTIAAPGVQFVKSSAGTATGDYFLDSITVAADAAGTFEVTMWTHVASSTGTTITVTSSGLSTTSLWKTYLPTGLNGNNLAFSWDLPAVIVKDTTYAVKASLTDKWGNPVATSTNSGVSGVTFQGFGSVTVNSSDAAVNKNFAKDGTTTVYVRSVKDVEGPGSLEATLNAANYSATSGATATALTVTEIASDVASTVWDETVFTNALSTDVEVLAVAPAASSDQKVNAGSFKGYVALYAKGYAGQRMSAKVGKDWVVVPALASNFERVVEFTGAGVDVAVRIYIDRVLMDTINLTTK